MTKREELQARLRDAERYREQYDAEARLIQEQLDALPNERVRLRAEKRGGERFVVYIGNECNESYIASVFPVDLARHGIKDDAFLAHICRFGEPDVSRETESLEAAVRASRLPLTAGVYAALESLDAARKGGA